MDKWVAHEGIVLSVDSYALGLESAGGVEPYLDEAKGRHAEKSRGSLRRTSAGSWPRVLDAVACLSSLLWPAKQEAPLRGVVAVSTAYTGFSCPRSCRWRRDGQMLERSIGLETGSVLQSGRFS